MREDALRGELWSRTLTALPVSSSLDEPALCMTGCGPVGTVTIYTLDGTYDRLIWLACEGALAPALRPVPPSEAC